MNNALSPKFVEVFHTTSLKRGAVFGGIIVVALIAFELFNFSTTDFALTDLLGNEVTFLGLRWATILSIAFCGIDFAGIARLFTPEQENGEEHAEAWYLFGAWALAAAMNATLTWWSVMVAISDHTSLGSAILGRELLTQVVPVFVAVMVWLIRLLIIGSFSMTGDRLFSNGEQKPSSRAETSRREALKQPFSQPVQAKPAFKPMPQSIPQYSSRPEPTYQPTTLSARTNGKDKGSWE